MNVGYADTYNGSAQSPWLRATLLCVLAALLHGLPLIYCRVPAGGFGFGGGDEIISINLDESVSELADPAKPFDPIKESVETKTVAAPSLEIPVPAVQAPKVAAAPVPTQTPPPVVQAPKPETAAPAPATAESRPALREPDLPAFSPKDLVAFDESKVTKEIPKEGYASDRNSTAADRGPKNLPRGDPFIDKGQSQIIRYLEKRGEGNLPALASSDTSGSVKKEGKPDAGKGLVDERPSDKKLPPKSPVAPDEVDPKSKPQEKTVVVKPDVAKPEFQALNTVVSQHAKEEQAPEKKIGREKSEDGIEPLAQNPETKKTIIATPNPEAKNLPPAFVETKAPETLHPDESAHAAATEKPRRNKEADELAAFAALIDGKGKRDGRGGDFGEKAGVPGRAGSKGHEGDGTLRPGHDEAVSDVTTINLDSSAEEFDEARFAKKFDAKTAYVKPLARRIDGKWKAEIVARNRFRLVRGAVAIKIVMRRDGKLLEASEVLPRQSGITDECVTIAKLAVQRAADPKSEPFSGELAGRETLEFVFTFLY